MNVSRLELDSDAEMPYEQLPHKRYTSWSDEGETQTKKIKGLPIKLPDGTIRKSAKVLIMSDPEQSSDESEKEVLLRKPETNVEDITTGARFGRAAIANIITKSSQRERVEAAKEQIASICQEILAGPENSVRKPWFLSHWSSHAQCSWVFCADCTHSHYARSRRRLKSSRFLMILSFANLPSCLNWPFSRMLYLDTGYGHLQIRRRPRKSVQWLLGLVNGNKVLLWYISPIYAHSRLRSKASFVCGYDKLSWATFTTRTYWACRDSFVLHVYSFGRSHPLQLQRQSHFMHRSKTKSKVLG